MWTKEKEMVLGQKLMNVNPREVCKFVINQVAGDRSEEIEKGLNLTALEERI